MRSRRSGGPGIKFCSHFAPHGAVLCGAVLYCYGLIRRPPRPPLLPMPVLLLASSATSRAFFSFFSESTSRQWKHGCSAQIVATTARSDLRDGTGRSTARQSDCLPACLDAAFAALSQFEAATLASPHLV